MKQKHTSGKWEVEQGRTTVNIKHATGCFSVGGKNNVRSQANAQRIVDCVNACEGIEKPEECKASETTLGTYELDYKEIKTQRETLLEACKEAECTITYLIVNPGAYFTQVYRNSLEKIKQAILEAEGKE